MNTLAAEAQFDATTTGGGEGENDWFFDIIITFLRSPRWKTPIMSFLDENCIIFDNDDENKLEYTSIHNEFKKIVNKIIDELLSELMAELDITQEQFLDACAKASSNPVHKKVVDQIAAVDNFIAFKKLMCKRNTELNEEALKMMLEKEQKSIQLHLAEQIQETAVQQQKQDQQTPGSTKTGTIEGQTVTDTGSIIHHSIDIEEMRREQMEYELALQMSMAFEEERQIEDTEEEKMLKMVMEMSLKEEQERLDKAKQEEKEQLKALKKIEKQSIQEAQRQQQKAEDFRQKEEKVIKQSLEEIKQVEIQPQVQVQAQEPVQIDEEEEKVASVKKQKEAKPGFQGYSLPPVAFKRGVGAFDANLLKEQQESILKGLNSMDEELNLLESKKNKDEFEGKTMSEVLKQKREETEKILENTKINQQESMEDRRQRLKAHRDMLLKMKKDQRNQELQDFNGKTNNKQDLHKELKEIDSKIQAKESIKRIEENFDIESIDSNDYDKRLAMYKGLKDQLLSDLANSTKAEQQAKMEELNKKISALEKAKREKEQKELQKFNLNNQIFQYFVIQRQTVEQARLQQNKGFLAGIKSYSIEDI